MANSGKFKVKYETPRGEREITYALNVEGETLTGTVTNANGSNPIRNTKVEGGTLTFTYDVETPGGTFTVTAQATIDGDKISGTLNNDRGSRPFSGTRVAE